MLAIDKAYMDTCAHIPHMLTEMRLGSHPHLVTSLTCCDRLTWALFTTEGTTVALKHSPCNYLDFIWLDWLASKPQGCSWLCLPLAEIPGMCPHVTLPLAVEIEFLSCMHSKHFPGSHLPVLLGVCECFLTASWGHKSRILCFCLVFPIQFPLMLPGLLVLENTENLALVTCWYWKATRIPCYQGFVWVLDGIQLCGLPPKYQNTLAKIT